MSTIRKPKGQPSGGQFAAHAKSEPEVALDDVFVIETQGETRYMKQVKRLRYFPNKEYVSVDVLHNEHGPALIHRDGTEEWFQHGHRVPAAGRHSIAARENEIVQRSGELLLGGGCDCCPEAEELYLPVNADEYDNIGDVEEQEKCPFCAKQLWFYGTVEAYDDSDYLYELWAGK